MFTDSTTKVDNEPLNGSNEDIINPNECEQTLNVSASTLNLSAGTLTLSAGMDIAKITRKWSKPDKHGHGNGKSAQEPGVF
ncbi:hypothetical protein Tco_0170983 [Tanacetum coccineum]